MPEAPGIPVGMGCGQPPEAGTVGAPFHERITCLEGALVTGAATPLVPAGYSGTPLPRKLGIGPGSRLALVEPPPGFLDLLVPWPAGAEVVTGGSDLDLAVAFVTRRAQLEPRHAALAQGLRPAGALWFAWPKRGSGVATDLNGDVLREAILPTGWVDNKVCAIDHTWSGLRFVRRRELRG